MKMQLEVFTILLVMNTAANHIAQKLIIIIIADTPTKVQRHASINTKLRLTEHHLKHLQLSDYHQQRRHQCADTSVTDPNWNRIQSSDSVYKLDKSTPLY